ncbi:hypothetical protein [Chromobacterium haemolyticum]|uniref:hypothetical protein n=1 Tax=Chromobacterium haemolyticum TaxID=394935 RepID=UPI0005B7A642|nr:hypothetical protein [Chromobacterium haemolyticum]
MQLHHITLIDGAEGWVSAALTQRSIVGEGTFSLVLDANQDGYVVKLTRSAADYRALVHFNGTNPHFPIVITHAANQGQFNGSYYHAVMMERLPKVHPLMAEGIANHINRQEIGKNNPLGLLNVAKKIENLDIPGYPATLAEAIRALGNYALNEMLFVELNQRINWGQRTDGTLVMFDLVHTWSEVAG